MALLVLAGCTGSANTDQVPVPASPSSKAAEAAVSADHHDGESSVMPHDDSQMEDDHHEGETNVVPHGHAVSSHDDSNQPPHRH